MCLGGAILVDLLSQSLGATECRRELEQAKTLGTRGTEKENSGAVA